MAQSAVQCYNGIPHSAVGTMHYSVIPYSTVWYHTVQCSTIQYSVVLYSTVWYHTVQCGTIQYSVIPYSSTVWYCTV